MTLIIGLGHRARQGKDYVANYMKEALPSLISTYSFARELKFYCKEHHDELLPQWQLAHQTKQVPTCKSDLIYGYTAILQWVGMKFREQDENYWVNKVQAKIEKEKPEIAVVTDCRFPNETAWVKENGGEMIEVIRRLEDGTQFVDPGRDPNHISETALDNYNFDFIISVRDGDLDALKSKAIGVLSTIINLEAEKDLNDDLSPHVFSDATGHY